MRVASWQCARLPERRWRANADVPTRSILLTGVGAPGQVAAAVARGFAERGDHVVLVGHDEARARDRAADLQQLGYRATAYGCDLADPAATDRLAAAVRADVGDRLDAAVLMAGGFAVTGPLDRSDPAEFERQLAINLRTAVFTTRSFLPSLRRARGALVYFSSEAVLPGASMKGIAGYAVAKAGVAMLMRAVAQDERANGVRANAIAPGTIGTAANLSAKEPPKLVDIAAVVHLVILLCSDTGVFMTGEIIHMTPMDRRQ